MAGRPKLRDLRNRIDDLGGIDWFCGEIENGKTLTKIAKELKVTPYLIYSYLNTDDYRQRMEEARQNCAHTLVAQAADLIDGANASNIAVRREQAKNRQWTAEKFNRTVYGQAKEPQVQVNIGIAHLTAMREYREIENAEITKVLPEETAATLPSPDSLDESLDLSECDESPDSSATD